MKLKIGTNSFGYNQRRNFIDLPFENVIFKKVNDLYKIPAQLNYRFRKKVIYKYVNRFNDLGLNNVNAYHFFNTISPVRKPWFVTFETSLPRLEPDFFNGYKWLAGKYCKKIIAVSQRAIDAQLFLLKRFPTIADEIKSKIIILPPAQKIWIDTPFLVEKKVVFTFVGGAFFRKGGLEMLKAFELLDKAGFAFHLNVISKLEIEGYLDEFVNDALLKKTRRMLKETPYITYHSSLANNDVIKLFKESHIGVLPSFGETYGYSVLEAMACGCAVVVTDLSPFREFVSKEWGWLACVPLFKTEGIERIDNKNQDELSHILTHNLFEIFKEICTSPEKVNQKMINALEAIRLYHDPLKNARTLETIYQQEIH